MKFAIRGVSFWGESRPQAGEGGFASALHKTLKVLPRTMTSPYTFSCPASPDLYSKGMRRVLAAAVGLLGPCFPASTKKVGQGP